MKSKEDIFDQALRELKNGDSVKEILSRYPQYSAELSPLLLLSETLFSLPKKSVPRPSMRRKFVLAPAKSWAFSSWLHITRFASVSMAAVLLLTGLAGTTYAALKSLPGEALFPLKKTAEKIQLQFTTDPLAKANMQVEIAQRRLSDAETVFSNPQKNSKQEIAALDELSQQTVEAAKTVQSVSANSSLTSNDHPLVQTFVDVTTKQQTLLNKIKNQQNVSVAVNTAQQANTEAKKVIAVMAATNDKTSLIGLSGDPNSVAMSGTVTHVSADSLNVDKLNFLINSETTIVGQDGQAIQISKIASGTVVDIVGIKSNDLLYAKEIDVLGSGQKTSVSLQATSTTASEVKGASTTTPSSASSTKSTAKEPVLKKEPGIQGTTTPAQDPNSAVGGFIPEDPIQQFFP